MPAIIRTLLVIGVLLAASLGIWALSINNRHGSEPIPHVSSVASLQAFVTDSRFGEPLLVTNLDLFDPVYSKDIFSRGTTLHFGQLFSFKPEPVPEPPVRAQPGLTLSNRPGGTVLNGFQRPLTTAPRSFGSPNMFARPSSPSAAIGLTAQPGPVLPVMVPDVSTRAVVTDAGNGCWRLESWPALGVSSPVFLRTAMLPAESYFLLGISTSCNPQRSEDLTIIYGARIEEVDSGGAIAGSRAAHGETRMKLLRARRSDLFNWLSDQTFFFRVSRQAFKDGRTEEPDDFLIDNVTRLTEFLDQADSVKWHSRPGTIYLGEFSASTSANLEKMKKQRPRSV